MVMEALWRLSEHGERYDESNGRCADGQES
jgi:hypothetical protein